MTMMEAITKQALNEAAAKRALQERLGSAFVPDGPVKNNAQTGGSTPSQYAIPEGAEELQDLIEYRDMNFAMGNIFKAAYRKGTKEGVSDEYELNKIIFFAKRELKRIQNVY